MCNAMLLYYLERCWNIIYYIVFLEGYAGDFWCSKSKLISDLSTHWEGSAPHAYQCVIFSVECAVQEEVKA